MKVRSRHRGYILLMTLLLLAVASVALAAVTAEVHLQLAQARRAQDDLQARWGLLSCARTFLPQAARVLNAARQYAKNPMNRVAATLRLNDQTITLVFADEQAKANINTLAGRLDQRTLRDTLAILTNNGGAVKLSPIVIRSHGAGGTIRSILKFDAYGQFVKASPRQLRDGLTERLTCWGDGKLNTQSASAEALSSVARIVLSKTEFVRFTQALRDGGTSNWRALFSKANVLPDKVKKMQQLVCEKSKTYSLWTIDEHAMHQRFSVDAEDGPITFEW